MHWAANCEKKGKQGSVKPLETTKRAFENYSQKRFLRTDVKSSAVCSLLREKKFKKQALGTLPTAGEFFNSQKVIGHFMGRKDCLAACRALNSHPADIGGNIGIYLRQNCSQDAGKLYFPLGKGQ